MMKRTQLTALTSLFVVSIFAVSANGQCIQNNFLKFHPSTNNSFTKEPIVTHGDWRRTWFTDRKKDECRYLLSSSINEVPVQQVQQPAADDAHELAKKLSNPVASLISFQCNRYFYNSDKSVSTLYCCSSSNSIEPGYSKLSSEV